MSKTFYSQLVDCKKKIFPQRIIPKRIGTVLDHFFNNLHNISIQSKDRSRDFLIHSKDITRDTLIRSHDLTRDTFIRTKDLTRDNLIRSRDLTRDALVKTKDVTRDSLLQSRDVTRDTLIRSKDLTRDNLIRSRDLTRDALIRTKDHTDDILKQSEEKISDGFFVAKELSHEIYDEAKKESYLHLGQKIIYPFVFIWNIFALFITSLALYRFNITEESDKEAVGHIRAIVVNSWNVKERVKKFYDRDAEVVHPPIATEKIKPGENKEYWLSVNRLTPEKRIEMQTESFRLLPEKSLIIVGGFDDSHRGYAHDVKINAPKNVEFAGAVDDDTLRSLYAHASGFITTSIDEDFGMNVVEAMAAGKPVIAPNEGGYKETILHKRTGVLLDDISPEKIALSVTTIDDELFINPKKYEEICIDRARCFSTHIFIGRIKEIVKKIPFTDDRM